MAVKLFAAIVIGSTETEMRVYEFSSRKGMKQIDCVSTRINLAASAYRSGRLDRGKLEQLCRTLEDYRTIMQGYKVDAYEVKATSAFRELESVEITADYIEARTGLKIGLLSNSEQRLLDYKSIASESSSFEEIIQSGTAIVDIGGNSMQISVFDKDKLLTTQNIHMGKINSTQNFLQEARSRQHFSVLIHELLEHELNGFLKLYRKDRPIKNLIVVDADLLEVVKKQKKTKKNENSWEVTLQGLVDLYEACIKMQPDEIREYYAVTADTAQLVLPSLVFARCLTEKMGAETIWMMDVTCADGMAYDYGIRNKLIKAGHDFDADILTESRSIAKRYKCNSAHARHMETLSLQIFDSLKKVHGLGQRERLLLQISAILHNCGKFISLVNVSDCAYNIIMATEIIGLSHAERQIIANVVRYNTTEFCYYEDMARMSDVTRDEFLVIAKLTAILRLANALDRGHRQKFEGCNITLKKTELLISVATDQDLTLEKVTLEKRCGFFEEVFNVHPIVKQKKQGGV